MGRLGSFRPAARPPDGVADCHDGLLLPDDAQAQVIFHVEQLLGLRLQHVADGDAGPCADHGGDVAGIDDIVQAHLGAPAFHGLVVFLFQPHPLRLAYGRALVVAGRPGGLFVGGKLL